MVILVGKKRRRKLVKSTKSLSAAMEKLVSSSNEEGKPVFKVQAPCAKKLSLSPLEI